MLSDERGTTRMHGGYIAHGIQKSRYSREFSKILRNNAKNGTSIRRLISKNEASFNSQKKRDDLNVRTLPSDLLDDLRKTSSTVDESTETTSVFLYLSHLLPVTSSQLSLTELNVIQRSDSRWERGTPKLPREQLGNRSHRPSCHTETRHPRITVSSPGRCDGATPTCRGIMIHEQNIPLKATFSLVLSTLPVVDGVAARAMGVPEKNVE